MDNLILIGGGGHARDIFGLIEHINEASPNHIKVTAILDDQWENTERFRGCQIPLVRGILDNLHLGKEFVACIGYPKNRGLMYKTAIEHGLTPYTALVHPRATLCSNVSVGKGSTILAGALISPNAVIGQNSYISVGTIIGHDTVLGDNVSVMPRASISGDVNIGSNVLIGSGAIILENLEIGDGAIVAAASLVTRNVKAGSTVMGIPARAVKHQGVPD
ncbi:MAG: acetyltransferase [Halioglobus sp.]